MAEILDFPMKIIPEGVYGAEVLSFGEVKQAKSGNYWYIKVHLQLPAHVGTTYVYGFLPAMVLLYRNRDHFVGQIWKVRVKHRTIRDGSIYAHLIYL